MSNSSNLGHEATSDFAKLAQTQLDGAATLLKSCLTQDEAELEKLVGQATMPSFVEGTLESAVHATPGVVSGPLAGVLEGAIAFAGQPIANFLGHISASVDAKARGFLAQGLAIIESRKDAADTYLAHHES